MTESDKKFRRAIKMFLAKLETAEQQEREEAAQCLKNDLEGKLSHGGQVFVDSLCELILT